MSHVILALTGGALIGLSATLLLLLHGRIAGISGILGQAISRTTPRAQRNLWLFFVLGLMLVGGISAFIWPERFQTVPGTPPLQLSLAGLLVGFGTRLGSGCTSGHGVCGIGRLSSRSIVATIVFVAVAALTVFVSKGFGGQG